MNISLLLKRLAVVLMVLGFAVGCAGTPENADSSSTGADVAEQRAAEDEAAQQAEADRIAAEKAEAEAQAAANAAGVTNYTVEKGDNLWSISGQSDIYDNPFQWPLIYKANRDQIKDADLIFPGQELEITRGMSDAEIDAAINHAKTRGAWSLGNVEESDQVYLSE